MARIKKSGKRTTKRRELTDKQFEQLEYLVGKLRVSPERSAFLEYLKKLRADADKWRNEAIDQGGKGYGGRRGGSGGPGGAGGAGGGASGGAGLTI